jgi:hypothetical protein
VNKDKEMLEGHFPQKRKAGLFGASLTVEKINNYNILSTRQQCVFCQFQTMY